MLIQELLKDYSGVLIADFYGAMTPVHAASRDAQGWHYQYQIQRQAGVLWNLHLQVTLPSCAAVKNTLGGLTSHNNKEPAMLDQTLNEDRLVGIDYAC